jgi:hypothetical protein
MGIAHSRAFLAFPLTESGSAIRMRVLRVSDPTTKPRWSSSASNSDRGRRIDPVRHKLAFDVALQREQDDAHLDDTVGCGEPGGLEIGDSEARPPLPYVAAYSPEEKRDFSTEAGFVDRQPAI